LAAYQASGTQLYWLDEDGTVIGFGFIEQQDSLAGLPGLQEAPAKTSSKQKKGAQPATR
jgi:hypothetical protein